MATTVDELGNVIEVVSTTEQVNQQNHSYIASGGANDDNPTVQKFDDGSSIQTFDDGSTLVTDSDGNITSTPTENTVNAGTTVSGKSDTPPAKSSTPKPGKRLENPLGNFASYTYQLTLYMITPDAYDAFIESGRRDINAIRNAANPTAAQQAADVGGGAYIIAQSGGINDKTSLRAPGFPFDFYIDNLRITSATNGKTSGASTNVSEMTFDIIEPYGFSFISRLKIAADALADYAKVRNFKGQENPSRQNFILGISFLGYDKDGKLLTGANTYSEDTFNPSGNSSGVFQRYFDILITEMKFKIDGTATTYKISAASTGPKVAFGIKNGRTHTGASATARTVKEALGGLNVEAPEGVIGIFTQMNQQQKDLVGKSIEIANEYDVRFVGDSVDIENATIISKLADPDKSKWPMAKAKDLSQINDKISVNATPDNTKRVITFKNDTSVLQMVTQIIAQSSYLENALKVLYTTAAEPDTKSDSPETVKPATEKTIKWYNISPEVKCLGFDNLKQDFAYRITYVIQPYETPVIVSSAANAPTKYYGPHKRYDYWFTGKNSEILRYEQQLDNSYFNVNIGSATGDKKDEKKDEKAGTGGATTSPLVPGMHQPVARLGKLGIGMEAQNSYVTSLTDPGSYAEAKISILGDPDFLIQEQPGSLSSVYSQFYGTDGYTINPNGGQVFIEIDFKEAVDYNNDNGLLTINESITFWKYPKKIQKIVKGVSYMVLEVISSFNKGKFTQDLTCNINTFGDVKDDPVTAPRAETDRETNSLAARYPAPTGAGSASAPPNGEATTGLVPDPSVTTTNDAPTSNGAVAPSQSTPDSGKNQVTAPTGGSSSNNGGTANRVTMPAQFGGTTDGTGPEGATYSSIFNLFPKTGNKSTTLTINTPAGQKVIDGTPDQVIAQLNSDIQKFSAYPNLVSLYTSARNSIVQQNQQYTSEYNQAVEATSQTAGASAGTSAASKAVADGDATGD